MHTNTVSFFKKIWICVQPALLTNCQSLLVFLSGCVVIGSDLNNVKVAFVTLKIKKICFSPNVSIQPCRPKSDSALHEAIGAQFRPKKLNQKAIPAHGRAYFRPGTKSALANWTVLALI